MGFLPPPYMQQGRRQPYRLSPESDIADLPSPQVLQAELTVPDSGHAGRSQSAPHPSITSDGR